MVFNKYTWQSQLIKSTIPIVVCFLWLVSCQESLPSEPLEAAFNVHARDNGNKGDASDIEVNYSQFGLDEIKYYRAFVLKSENEGNHDIDFLQTLGELQYLDLAPNEVIPSRGKRLPSSMLDSDGDQIIPETPYRLAVISFPIDAESYLPTIAYSNEDLILRINNLVSNHSNQIEIGSGELAIDDLGTIIMASYDVINDLTTGGEASTNLLTINDKGETSNSDEIYPYLGGAGIDDEGNFYVSNTKEAEILRYSLNGSLEVIQLQGIQLKQPTGIFIDQKSNIFVADRESGSILHIDQDANSSFYAQVGAGILGLTGDNKGNLYASINTEEGQIVKISSDGVVREMAQVPTFVKENYPLPFISWIGHLEYHDSMLYVAGTSTDRIYTISLDGVISVFAGSGDRLLPYGDALSADFNRPLGLVFSGDGNTLYVSGCEDTTPSHVQASYPSRVYKIEIVE